MALLLGGAPFLANTGRACAQGDGYETIGPRLVEQLSESVASGDLPSSVQVLRNDGGDEGTAMLEIIHDLAPGSPLAFHGPGSSSDMVAGIGALKNAGCNIIVDDKGYSAEPKFDDGPIAQEARQFCADGGVYVSSAGNGAQEHYIHQYVRTTGPGSGYDYGGGDLGNGFTVRQPGHRHGLIQLNPSEPLSFPAPSTTSVELYYDDGEADAAYGFADAGGERAVRFTPPSYPVSLETARICLGADWPDSDHEQFAMKVYDDSGTDGEPGTCLGTQATTATNWGWWDVDISGLGIVITGGDFYIAYEQLTDSGFDYESVCADEDAPDGRSWSYWGGEWSLWQYGDHMIRCVVEVGEANNPPNTPSNPSPAHQATGVSVDADLSWTGSDPDPGDTVTYDVHFGTNMSPPLVSNDQSATTYDPGTLANNTKYYWRIVATDNHAAFTTGPLWDFTTAGVPGQAEIAVSPTDFQVTLPQNTTQDYTLNIGNTGDATLTYSISDRDTTGPTAPAGVEPPAVSARQPGHRIQLNPSQQPLSFPAPSTTGVEIYYDDGEADAAYGFNHAGGEYAVRFTPPSYPVSLETAKICLWADWPDSDHEQFAMKVYDDSGADGEPGTCLGTQATTATNWGWWDVDISGLGIVITGGDFYIAYEQLTDSGSDYEGVCDDEDAPDGRSWSYEGGEWSPWQYGDYMIRCVVELGEANNPPNTPSNPSPAHQATGVSVNADLSWTGGDPDPGDTLTYDVHFGTSASPPLVSNDQSATTYDPGTLANNTKYYWKIVATDNHTAFTTGPLWDFTTGEAGEDCPWLDESPESGTVDPGNSDSVTVSMNTAGLAPGNYSADIVIANNDPDESPKIVPVSLTVAPPGDEDNPDVATGLDSISGCLVVVYGFDNATKTWSWYNPSWPPGANTLATLDMGSGYWINVREGCDFLTYGANTYELYEGWNLIGWLGG